VIDPNRQPQGGKLTSLAISTGISILKTNSRQFYARWRKLQDQRGSFNQDFNYGFWMPQFTCLRRFCKLNFRGLAV
jgi:hypothetical protein